MPGTLILATHGIAGGPGSAAWHARAIRRRGGWTQVRVGCLKADPSLAQAMAGAPGPVTVVPLLMSEGVIHGLMRRRLREIAPQGGWHLTVPVGTHPRLAALALGRARACCRRLCWRPDDTDLLLIGHGTPRQAASAGHTRGIAELLAGQGFAAVGLFLDDGPHGDADVRVALRAAEKPVAYSGAIGADAGLVPLILAQAAAQ